MGEPIPHIQFISLFRYCTDYTESLLQGPGGMQPTEKRFIRRERAPGLKKADMLIPLGVALQDSKSGGQHVHQPVVSRVRHPGLSVRPHGLHRGADDLHPPPGARAPAAARPAGPPTWCRAVTSSGASAPCPSAPVPRPSSSPSRASSAVPVGWCARSTSPSPTRGGATPGVREVRAGTLPQDDHPRRGRPPGRRLGPGQGHPEARPVAALSPGPSSSTCGGSPSTRSPSPRATGT